ncbi:hypothetical protein QQ045_025718 [Rhodiola kirilowii]
MEASRLAAGAGTDIVSRISSICYSVVKSILYEMKEHGVSPDEMKNSGINPDDGTYNSLIYGLCCAGKMEEGRHMFDEMKNASVSPDVVTYSVN